MVFSHNEPSTAIFGPRQRRGPTAHACAVGWNGSGPVVNLRRHTTRLVMRPVEEHTFPPTTASSCTTDTGRQRPRPRAARSCCFHRGHEHSGRIAHLADELDLPDFACLRLGRPRPRPLARRSAATARASARRCATSRRSSSTSRTRARRRRADMRGGRAERRRRAGRDLGARLRAAPCAAWCSPRRPSRSSSTCRSRAPGWADAASCAATSSSTRYVKSQFLTHDPERIAVLRRRSADRAADLGQHPARRSTTRPSASSPTRAPSPCRRSC